MLADISEFHKTGGNDLCHTILTHTCGRDQPMHCAYTIEKYDFYFNATTYNKEKLKFIDFKQKDKVK